MNGTTQPSALIAQTSMPAPPAQSGLDWTVIIVAVTTGVIGILTGVTTGWITAVHAPKVNWKVERERLDYERKKEIIRGIREIINDKTKTIDDLFRHPDFHHILRYFGPPSTNKLFELKNDFDEFKKELAEHETGIGEYTEYSTRVLVEYGRRVNILAEHPETIALLRRLSCSHDVYERVQEMLCDLEINWSIVKY